MARATNFPFYAESAHYSFKDLLVAYDFSEAADTSLKYAVMLSRHFRSFIHLLSVQSPAEYSSALESGPLAMQLSQRDLQFDLRRIEKRLRTEGIENDATRRIGNVSDIVEGAILEQKPDLLLLGAFGYGPADRPRLGSTAEHLLRSVRCPVLTVGPHAILHEREAPPIQRILCATSSLVTPDDIVFFAGQLAARMKAQLEIVHAVDATHQELPKHHHEQRCEEWRRSLSEHAISVSWTLLYGTAGDVIAARASESKASVILFGLHRRGNTMIDCPDGVVSATIRQAHCPVMTVPLGLRL